MVAYLLSLIHSNFEMVLMKILYLNLLTHFLSGSCTYMRIDQLYELISMHIGILGHYSRINKLRHSYNITITLINFSLL